MAKKDEKKKGLKKLADKIKNNLKENNKNSVTYNSRTRDTDSLKGETRHNTNVNKAKTKKEPSVNINKNNSSNTNSNKNKTKSTGNQITTKSNTTVKPNANSEKEHKDSLMDKFQDWRINRLESKIDDAKNGEHSYTAEQLENRKASIENRKETRNRLHHEAEESGYRQLDNNERTLYENAVRQFGGNGEAINNYFNAIGRPDIVKKVAKGYEYSAKSNQLAYGVASGLSPISMDSAVASQAGRELDVADAHTRAYNVGYMMGNVAQSASTGGFMGIAENVALNGVKGFGKAAGFNALVDLTSNAMEGAKTGAETKTDIEANKISTEDAVKNGYSVYDGKTKALDKEAGKQHEEAKGFGKYDSSLANWNNDVDVQLSTLTDEEKKNLAVGVDKYGYKHYSVKGEEYLQKILGYYDTAENPEYTMTSNGVVTQYSDTTTRDALASFAGNTVMSGIIGGGMEMGVSKLAKKGSKKVAEGVGEDATKTADDAAKTADNTTNAKPEGDADPQAIKDTENEADPQAIKDAENELEEGEEIVDTADKQPINDNKGAETTASNTDSQSKTEASNKAEETTTETDPQAIEDARNKPPKNEKGNKNKKKNKKEQTTENENANGTVAEEPTTSSETNTEKNTNAAENASDPQSVSDEATTSETSQKLEPKPRKKTQKQIREEVHASDLTEDQKKELAKTKGITEQHVIDYGATKKERKAKLKDKHKNFKTRINTLSAVVDKKEKFAINKINERVGKGTATNSDVEILESKLSELETKYADKLKARESLPRAPKDNDVNTDTQQISDTHQANTNPQEIKDTSKLPKDEGKNTNAQEILDEEPETEAEKKLTKAQKKKGEERVNNLYDLSDEFPMERDEEVDRYIFEKLDGSPNKANVQDDDVYEKLMADLKHAKESGEPLKFEKPDQRNLNATNKGTNAVTGNKNGGDLNVSKGINDATSNVKASEQYKNLDTTDTDPRLVTGNNLQAIRTIVANKDKYPKAYAILKGFFGEKKDGTLNLYSINSRDDSTTDFILKNLYPKASEDITKHLDKVGKDKKTRIRDVWSVVLKRGDEIAGKSKETIKEAAEIKKKWGVPEYEKNILESYGFDGKSTKSYRKAIENMREELYKRDDILNDMVKYGNISKEQYQEYRNVLKSIDDSAVGKANEIRRLEASLNVIEDVEKAFKSMDEIDNDLKTLMKKASDLMSDNGKDVSDEAFEEYMSAINALYSKKKSITIDLLNGTDSILKNTTPLIDESEMVALRDSLRDVVDHMSTVGYGKDISSLYERTYAYDMLANEIKMESDSELVNKALNTWKESETIASEFTSEFDKAHNDIAKEIRKRYEREIKNQKQYEKGGHVRSSSITKEGSEIYEIVSSRTKKMSKKDAKTFVDNEISNKAKKMLGDAILNGESELFGVKLPTDKYNRLINNANGLPKFIDTLPASEGDVEDALKEVKSLCDSYIVRITDRIPDAQIDNSARRIEEARKVVEDWEKEKAEKARIAEKWRRSDNPDYIPLNETLPVDSTVEYADRGIWEFFDRVEENTHDVEEWRSNEGYRTAIKDFNAYSSPYKELSDDSEITDIVGTRTKKSKTVSATESNKRITNMKRKFFESMGVDTTPRLNKEQSKKFSETVWGEFKNKTVSKEELSDIGKDISAKGRELGKDALNRVLTQKNFNKKNVQRGVFNNFCKKNGIEFTEENLKKYQELVKDLYDNPPKYYFPSNDAGKQMERIWNQLELKAQKNDVTTEDFVKFIFDAKELAFANKGTFRLGKNKIKEIGINTKAKHSGRIKDSERMELFEDQLMKDLRDEFGIFGDIQNKARMQNGVIESSDSYSSVINERKARAERERARTESNLTPEQKERLKKQRESEEKKKAEALEKLKKLKEEKAEKEAAEKAKEEAKKNKNNPPRETAKKEAVSRARADGVEDENTLESVAMRAQIQDAVYPQRITDELPVADKNVYIEDSSGNKTIKATVIDEEDGIEVLNTDPQAIVDDYTRSTDSLGITAVDEQKAEEIAQRAIEKKKNLRTGLYNSQEVAENMGRHVDKATGGNLDAKRTIEAKFQRTRNAKQSADHQVHNGVYDSEGRRLFTDDMTEEKYWSMNRKQRRQYDRNHTIGGLLKQARKGKFYDELQAYMFHQLNIERTAKGKAMFSKGTNSKAVVEGIEKSANGQKIKEIAEELRKISEVHARDRLVGSGYMSEENFKKYVSEWNAYVPAYRELDGTISSVADEISVNEIPTMGRVSSKTLKRVKRSDARLLPLLEQYNKKFENLENMVRQNDANDYIINLIKENPEATKDFGIYVTDSPKNVMKAVADTIKIKYEGTKIVKPRKDASFTEGSFVKRKIDGNYWNCEAKIINGEKYYVPVDRGIGKENVRSMLDTFMENTRKFSEEVKDFETVDYTKAEKFVEKFIKDNKIPEDNKSILMSLVNDDVTRLRQRDAFDVAHMERDAFLKDLTGAKKAYELVAYKDGKEIKALISSDMALAIESVTNPTMLTQEQKHHKKVYSMARVANDIFKFGHTTGNPVFHLRNFFRDGGTYLIQSEAGGLRRIGNMGRALAGMAGDDNDYAKLWKIYKANGGESANFSQVNKAIINGKTPLHMMGKYINDAFTSAGNAGESFWRFAEFCEGMNKYADKPNRVELAMEMAADVTVNFGKSGSITRTFDACIPYLNASIQGLVKTAKTFKEHPVASAAWGLTTITSVYALDTALLWNNPNYQKLSDEVRQKNFIIPIDGGFGTATNFIKIPLSREYAIPFAAVFEMALDYAYGDSDASKALNRNVNDAFWISDSNLARGWVDAKNNRNYFGSQLTYNTDGLYSEEVNDDTSALAKGIASVGNKVFEKTHFGEKAYDGGSQQLAGWSNITSPVRVDYLLDNYAGFLGTLARGSVSGVEGDGIVDSTAKFVGNRINGVRDDFKKSFTANATNASENVNDYYNNKEMYEHYSNSQSTGLEKVLAEEYKRYNNKVKVKATLPDGTVWKSDEGIKSINSQIKRYKNDPTLSYKERNAYVKAYKNALDKYTTKANESVAKIEKGYEKNPEWYTLSSEQRSAYKKAGGKDALGMSKKKYAKACNKVSEYAEKAGYSSVDRMANGYKSVAMIKSGVTTYEQAKAICGDDFSESAWTKYTYMKKYGVTFKEFDKIYKKKQKLKSQTNENIRKIVYSSDLSIEKKNAIYHQIKNDGWKK